MFKAIKEEEIQEQINWLVDDNHAMMAIIRDETADPGSVSEAKYRLSANRSEIVRLNDQLETMRRTALH